MDHSVLRNALSGSRNANYAVAVWAALGVGLRRMGWRFQGAPAPLDGAELEVAQPEGAEDVVPVAAGGKSRE